MKNEVKQSLAIMGYDTLLPIQESVIPHLMEKENVIVKSFTGSGKTAAFGIPICEHIEWDQKEPQACILVPTRELAKQVSEELSQIGRLKKIKVVSIVGKESMSYQKEQLMQKCHILVATPGRLMDHITQGNVGLDKIQYFILDEADYMMDLGFKDQLETILSSINTNCCFGFFSATYPPKMRSMIDVYCQDAIYIEEDGSASITHYYCTDTLENILKSIDKESTILFCNQKDHVYTIKSALKKLGIACCILHGDMVQKKRNEAMAEFKAGKYKILVASDVASRGLDIEKVHTIIHTQIPKDKETYIHRCGRSGRNKEKGISIIMVENLESVWMQDFLMEEYTCKEGDLSLWNETIQKTDKEDHWKETVCKLYLNAGKDKKIRVGDIIGAFCSVEGVSQDDLGVIEVLHNMSFIEVFNQKETILLEAFQKKTIKKKKVRLEKARD